MPFPPGATTYTFNGITMARVLESVPFVPWFFPESQYTADPILGGSQVYLDLGGDNVTTLSMRLSCASAADRFAMRSSRGVTGTLANSRTRTDTATLVKASPVDSDPYQLWLIDCTFILRP